MSIRETLPSSADNTASVNNSSPSKRKPIENNDHNAASGSTTTTDHGDHNGGALALSNLIRQDLFFLKEAFGEVKDCMEDVNVKINQACEKFEELQTRGGSETELHQLKKFIGKMKFRIPSHLKIRHANSSRHRNSWPDIYKGSDGMVDNRWYKESMFEYVLEIEDLLKHAFNCSYLYKRCLVCFFKFPAMAVIRRRVMIYWWIGEGFLNGFYSRIGFESEEDMANALLDVLIAKGFIEPVYQKCSLVPDSCRMTFSVRSALTTDVERSIFTSEYPQDQDIQYPQRSIYSCLINHSASIVDAGAKLFEKIKNAKIVYLGRWQNSVRQHIEVTDTKILDGLKNMHKLRFLSLRGISLITELPSFISELTSLKILDLRACHNLEVVPCKIGLLKNLTHLDMSECYFLEYMPKSLANLPGLQVLKGFFIGDSEDKRSCTLDDLARVSTLRKLNIYTNMKEFPMERHLRALEKLEDLYKLTITWGGCSLLDDEENAGIPSKDDATESLATNAKHQESKGHGRKNAHTTIEETTPPPSSLKALLTTECGKPPPTLPSMLQKLDLRGFHGTSPPPWMRSTSLKQLEKLYIRGGRFCDLGQFEKYTEEEQWAVEILQLKYLGELEMDWRELKVLFPKLIYLSKVQCPKLTNFPGDESGVWMNTKEVQPLARNNTMNP